MANALGGVLTRPIVNVPQLAAELGIVAAVVTLFVVVHALLQRRFRSEMLQRHNDVAGPLFSAVGVLYAVVLGFVVVVVWQKYDGTVSNVENEVNATGDLYHVVDGFPAGPRSRIRSGLMDYVVIVLRDEWPDMARKENVPQLGLNRLESVSHMISTFSPANFEQFAAQQAAIADDQRLMDARRSRLIEAIPAVPAVLWFALVVGALSMVAFCYIFGVENRPAQLMMTAILVGLIGILFVVIEAFSTPFSGSVRISAEGWTYLQQHLPQIP